MTLPVLERREIAPPDFARQPLEPDLPSELVIEKVLQLDEII